MPINKETLNKRLEKALGRYRAKAVDVSGDVIPLADEADAFKFNFTKDGEDYGTVYVTIDDTSKLTLWFDDDVMNSPSASTPGVDYDDSWSGFLEYMKKWALKNQLRFDKDNKDNLGAEMARRKSMKQKEQIAEGYHAMGKKASYNDAVPNVKIVLQHSKVMQEGEQRFRHIEKIFVENQLGERFLVPTTKPGLARVFARHIAEGGTPYDERAGHIQSLVEEYNKMAGFVRATKNGQFNESAQQLVQEGIDHYVKLRESLGKLTGRRGYTAYFESWTPPLMEDETDATAINELFVQETLDPRIESVMPILSRLHKQVAEMKEVSELDEWAESLLSEKMVMGADTDASSGGTVNAYIEEDEGIQSQNPQGIPEGAGGKVEAHGVHGMKSKPWRKVFKNQAAFEAWLEKNEGNVEVHGTRDVEESVEEGKTGPGLWANIHAKQNRIKHGSGEKMRKPGSKGAPTAQNFKDAAKESVETGSAINENADVLAGLTDILKIAASRQAPQNPSYFAQQVKDVALQLKDNPATQKWSSYLDGVVRWADVIASGKEQYSPQFANEVHSVLGPATRAYQDALLNKQGVAEGQLNELGPKTIKRYINKATKDKANREKMYKTHAKVNRGIDVTPDDERIAKADIKKLSKNKQYQQFSHPSYVSTDGPTPDYYQGMKADHRTAGLDRAGKRKDKFDAPTKRKNAKFTEYSDYDNWLHATDKRDAYQEETEIDGYLVTIAQVDMDKSGYEYTDGKTVGIWYNQAGHGTIVEPGVSYDDCVEYAEIDPYYPDTYNESVAEDLDANQKRVGQLGPTEKVKNNNIGKLVGANESVESTMKLLDMLSENFINSTAQAVTTEGADYGDLENEYYYVIDTQSGKVVDGPFDSVGEVPLRLMGFDGGHKVAKGSELKGHEEVTENYEDNPVVNAITRRILVQRADLLEKYGPEKVRDAIESEAEFVGDVEEIGSSDVSGWVRNVERTLQQGEESHEAFKGMFGGDADELTKGLRIREDELEEGKSDDPDYDESLKRFKKGLPPKKQVDEGQEGRPYVCVHAKKGQCNVTANSSYEAAQKAAAKWGLKNTSGIDAHLTDTPKDPASLGEGQEDLDAILRIIRK